MPNWLFPEGGQQRLEDFVNTLQDDAKYYFHTALQGGATGTTQSMLNQLANQVSEVQSSLGVVQAKVYDGTSSVIDVAKTALEAVGGIGSSGFWNGLFNSSPPQTDGQGNNFFVGDALGAAIWCRYQLMNQVGRLPQNLAFVYQGDLQMGINGIENVSQLINANPANQHADETDIDFLQRVAPGVAWQSLNGWNGRIGVNYFPGGGLFTGISIAYAPELQTQDIAATVFDLVPPFASGTPFDGWNWGKILFFTAGILRASVQTEAKRYIGLEDWLISGIGYDFGADGAPGVIDLFVPSLTGIDAADQNLNETDLAFVERKLPEMSWSSPFTGGQFPKATITDGASGRDITVVYSPSRRFKDDAGLFAYLPSSGEPYRSVMKQMAKMMALLPIVYGQSD